VRRFGLARCAARRPDTFQPRDSRALTAEVLGAELALAAYDTSAARRRSARETRADVG